MSIQKIYDNGLSGALTIPATESIAVRSLGGPVQVYQVVGYPNVPSTKSLIGTVSAGSETVFGAYASGATIELEASEGGAKYAIGVGPKVGYDGFIKEQAAPGALNATGTLTVAMMATGIVTSTAGAAVVATFDTGTVIDAALDLAIGEAFDFSVIVTGANTFTLTAATGVTIVGDAVVAANGSSTVRMRKTAANTFVCYRLTE
jgi:hypothetical protein